MKIFHHKVINNIFLEDNNLKPIDFPSGNIQFPENLIKPYLNEINLKVIDSNYQTLEYKFNSMDYKYLTRLYLELISVMKVIKILKLHSYN